MTYRALGSRSLVVWLASIAAAGLAGCFGLVEPEPGSQHHGDAAFEGSSEGSSDGGLDARKRGRPEASLDRLDASRSDGPDAFQSCVTRGPYGVGVAGAHCTPPAEAPADDVVIFNPSPDDVPAGSYGFPSVVAAGPWTQDLANPVFLTYLSTTLPTTFLPYITDLNDGGVSSLLFQIPSDAVGQTGTMTVYATNGIIGKHASLTVNVGPCKPWSTEEACQGATCGTVDDGCGGKESCGMCGESAPYCFDGVPPFGAACISCRPVQCYADNEGFDGKLCRCVTCPDGCIKVDDACACPSQSGPPPPGFP